MLLSGKEPVLSRNAPGGELCKTPVEQSPDLRASLPHRGCRRHVLRYCSSFRHDIVPQWLSRTDLPCCPEGLRSDAARPAESDPVDRTRALKLSGWRAHDFQAGGAGRLWEAAPRTGERIPGNTPTCCDSGSPFRTGSQPSVRRPASQTCPPSR